MSSSEHQLHQAALDHAAVVSMLQPIADDLVILSGAIGKAYGMALADRIWRISQRLHSVRMALEAAAIPLCGVMSSYSRRRTEPLNIDKCAHVRKLAASIIDPAIPYEPPSRIGKRLTGHLQFREHLVIADKLWLIERQLFGLASHVASAYGTNNLATRRCRMVRSYINRLRDTLEAKLLHEVSNGVHDSEGMRPTVIYQGWRNSIGSGQLGFVPRAMTA